MIAFDSNILIYVLESDPEFGKKAEAVFYDIEEKGGICSSLVITEAMYGRFTSKMQLGPLQSDSIQTIPVTEIVAEAAGRLKIQYSLGNLDAIHIATALVAQAEIFVTNDHRLLKKKIKGITLRGLTGQTHCN